MHRIFLPVICKTNVPTYIIIAYLYIYEIILKKKKKLRNYLNQCLSCESLDWEENWILENFQPGLVQTMNSPANIIAFINLYLYRSVVYFAILSSFHCVINVINFLLNKEESRYSPASRNETSTVIRTPAEIFGLT